VSSKIWRNPPSPPLSKRMPSRDFFNAGALSTVDSLSLHFLLKRSSQPISEKAKESFAAWALWVFIDPHKAGLKREITLRRARRKPTPEDRGNVGKPRSQLKELPMADLYYNYFCALDPESDRIYVKIRSDVFRKNRTDYLKDATEQLFGNIVSRIASIDWTSRLTNRKYCPKMRRSLSGW